MRVLFFVVTAGILYLSLFPGRFDGSRPFFWVLPFQPVRYWSDVVDVVINVPFYLPWGFAAVAAWAGKKPGWRAIAYATLFGTMLSYGVELAQQWIVPRRFATSRDVVLNAAGAAWGAWLATRPGWRKWQVRRPLYAFGQTPAAWWLMALWWTWLAFPFFPNLRFVQLRRMVEHAQEELAGAGLAAAVLGTHFVGAAVLGSVSRGRRWLMPVLALAAVFAMTFIYGLRFSPMRVGATVAGLALASFWDFRRRGGWLALLAVGWAAVYLGYYGAPGLAPYDTMWEVTPEAARASWRTPVRDGAGKLLVAWCAGWAVWGGGGVRFVCAF